METTIKYRTYKVEKMDTSGSLNLRADLLRRGYDGETYILKGKRSATKMAYRTKDGKFKIVA